MKASLLILSLVSCTAAVASEAGCASILGADFDRRAADPPDGATDGTPEGAPSLSDAAAAPDAGDAGCEGPPCGIASGTLVLFGGDDVAGGTDQLDNGTWTFDGATWKHVATANAPSPRAGASMAALGHRVVLFGGDGAETLNEHPLLYETWIFDGKRWSQVTTPVHPPGRAFAAMATLNGKIVLFGGEASSDHKTIFNDTWTFDGTSWTQVPTPVSPPPYLSYDSTNMIVQGERLVLVSQDTWAFDGAAWTKLAAPKTPANTTNGAVLAPLHDALIVYSTGSDDTEAAATWKLQGSTWTKIPADADASASDIPDPSFVRPIYSLGDHIRLLAPAVYSGGPIEGWNFDGARWTKIPTSNAPPSREYVAYAYVP